MHQSMNKVNSAMIAVGGILFTGRLHDKQTRIPNPLGPTNASGEVPLLYQAT